MIDSLSGFELALAPTFREDFRESLYRMVTAITGMGVNQITVGAAMNVNGVTYDVWAITTGVVTP